MLNRNSIRGHQCDAHLMKRSMALPIRMIFVDLKPKVGFFLEGSSIFHSETILCTAEHLHFDGPVVPDEQNTPIASFSASTRIGL